MRILLSEIQDFCPGNVKSSVLDRQIGLGYTSFILACQCGNIEVADMLRFKGCNTAICNYSGKTGQQLFNDYQREVELSLVHPWSSGAKLHLAAESPEELLKNAEAELNVHVKAGMKVWNAKQMVGHFDHEQIQALETQLKQLVCQGCILL